MMPSPVSLTSRPPDALTASRTMVSWTRRRAVATSSPRSCVSSVEPTMSVNRTVRIPGSRSFPVAPGTSAARGIHLASSQEALWNLGFDLDDLLREQAVRFTMDPRYRFGARRAAQAENLPAALVEPVLVILDAVLSPASSCRRCALSQHLPRSLRAPRGCPCPSACLIVRKRTVSTRRLGYGPRVRVGLVFSPMLEDMRCETVISAGWRKV